MAFIVRLYFSRSKCDCFDGKEQAKRVRESIFISFSPIGRRCSELIPWWSRSASVDRPGCLEVDPRGYICVFIS